MPTAARPSKDSQGTSHLSSSYDLRDKSIVQIELSMLWRIKTVADSTKQVSYVSLSPSSAYS